MKFKEGKIIHQFNIKKKNKIFKIIFRFPKKSDAKDAMITVNRLIEENAFIAASKKKTLKEERDWINDSIKKMKNKEIIFIVVEINGKYTGSGQIEKGNEAMSHVGSLAIAIDKEFRGLGIGKRLIERLVKESKEILKIKLVKLSYFEGNPAEKLYKKLGFKKCGKLPKGFKKDNKFYNKITMYRDL